MNSLFKLCIFTLLIASTNLYAGGKIIKWVDKNGVIQYGDKLPMPNKAEKASVLSNQGITVQNIEQKSSNNEQDQALAVQTRHDHALLASYSSIEEIEIACKRNTRTDELALATLRQKLDSLRQQLPVSNKPLTSSVQVNQEPSKENVKVVEQVVADIANVELQIKAKEETINGINQRYEKDKVRFAELESRKGKLHDIKYAKKNIAELEKWRADAQKRVEFYESKNIEFKRAGNESPLSIRISLLNATQELERANAEKQSNNLAIKKSKEQLSR
jgi:hypothetical protein